MHRQRGFTLIELLVVIAIVAVTATVLVLVLNPAQLLKQARDSRRISDFNTLRRIAVLAQAENRFFTSDAGLCNQGVDMTLYPTTDCTTRYATMSSYSVAGTSTAVDGTSWFAIDFRNLAGGTGISVIPLDPISNATYYYSAAVSTNGINYEMNAQLESTKYASKAVTDGGDRSDLYEVGNEPGLDL